MAGKTKKRAEIDQIKDPMAAEQDAYLSEDTRSVICEQTSEFSKLADIRFAITKK